MKIGELAKRSGVPAKTIRYYESIGLIAAASRTQAGYRDYGLNDVRVLRFVQRARGLGFGIDDLRELLNLWHDRQRASADVRGLATRHIDAITHKIAELQSMQGALRNLIEQCHGDHRPDCPILEQLAGDTPDHSHSAVPTTEYETNA